MTEENGALYGSFSERDLFRAFEACMELSNDGFLIVDPDGKIVFINTAYSNYIGTSRESAVGTPVLDLIPTSKMVEVANNVFAPAEVNVLHRVSNDQFQDREPFAIVNRANVSRGGRSLGAVAQIKFIRTTLKLSKAINDLCSQIEYYRSELEHMSRERYSIDQILGISEGIVKAKELVWRAAQNDFPVLITGETGTGKEVLANAVHYAGGRRMKPLIRINCAAIPTDLMEAELFGYEEGSFTDAKRGGKKGKFELADGGTVFLDEIGEMPLPMQAKLLRALQENEIERIGAEKPIHIDIRVISATNKDLRKEIEKNRFRKDLYYRLNVIEIHIPPLRSRVMDIPLLMEHFLREIDEKYHTNTVIEDEVKELLMRYEWPGNVRELKNVLERCYALSEK
ncbi:MAG TPA: sigma 54-interacting transcriptional regulator, partial [Oscillospiraceae bacterium]|nr:sigma 54-interacting transcriptional regulator [Oscillospiraceae bacterium]